VSIATSEALRSGKKQIITEIMPTVNSARLIIAASETNADQLYATAFFAPDPFLFIETDGRTAVLLSDLEIDRGRKQASVDDVVAYSEIEKLLPRRGKKPPPYAAVAAAFLKTRGVRRARVPAAFPLGLARDLEERGVRIAPVAGHFWPGREIKSDAELRQISRALRNTEIGLTRGIEVLKSATIRKDRKLVWGGGVLTSERLRAEIESAILHAGGFASNNSIIAGGQQACDPHERGHGPLRAHELIILDVFPRDARTGYYGDLTRTVVRGRANDAQRRLWETCLDGQRMALRAMKPGVAGFGVHERVKGFFTEQGYPTELRDGRWRGFFHGTGHGLGLDLHEEPRMARTVFKPGQVFTVEPGIYVPGIGGVRHEDVVTITAKKNRVLSRFPKPVEI
jgi:Xaa-Pro aminopeptidase